MILKTVSVEKTAIVMKVVLNTAAGDDTKDVVSSTVTAKDQPLPSFTKAFVELGKVFCSILETGDEWVEGLTVNKLTVTHTKQGTRSVVMEATKQLDCRSEFLHVVSTPSVQIDKAADGESGAVAIDGKLAKKIATALHEVEEYYNGKRSQQTIDFDQAKAGINALADKGRDKNQKSLSL